MKKIISSPWLALLTVLILLGIRISDPSFVESIRLRYFDTLINNSTPTQNNIYSVNIDEDALEKYGQWPFKRSVYAQIIKDLYERNAGLVVFNVLMPESDKFGQDTVLASTMHKMPVVLPNIPNTKQKNTPRDPGSAIIGSDFMGKIIQYPGIIANIPILEQAAVGTGIVNTLPEIDGVVRRLPMIINANGVVYPSLALETLRVISGDPSFQVKLSENGVEKLRIPKFGPITTDSVSRIWIDWSQDIKSSGLASLPDDFNESVVVVGVSAAGISNPVATPQGSVHPHTLQAKVIGTLINGVSIQRPDWADVAELIFASLFSIISILLVRWKYGFVPVIIIATSIHFICQFIFGNYRFLFDSTMPVMVIVLSFLHVYVVKFITELNAKLLIKKQFSTYLSPAMVEKLQKKPELLTLGGESRELSIMFSDVRGFTTISEHYGEDVQGLTSIMNRYMTAMTSKIIENNGTLDKYIGDAQMAFWNAPITDKNHAKHAVKAALEMLECLDNFNDEISLEGIPAFGMGLGINTATVVVGNMGSSQRFDYTCLGDGVNLASRLEGQSKNYGVKIIIGPETAKQVQDKYPVIELDCIAVKGKSVGVRVYQLLD